MPTIITFLSIKERIDLITIYFRHQKTFCEHILSIKVDLKIRSDTSLVHKKSQKLQCKERKTCEKRDQAADEKPY